MAPQGRKAVCVQQLHVGEEHLFTGSVGRVPRQADESICLRAADVAGVAEVGADALDGVGSGVGHRQAEEPWERAGQRVASITGVGPVVAHGYVHPSNNAPFGTAASGSHFSATFRLTILRSTTGSQAPLRVSGLAWLTRPPRSAVRGLG